jgi:LmbE family N-acetylglucosaminyl deacetylase
LKIVVLSPHRDDAAFSLSLALETWIAKGHVVQVINCFTRSAFAPFSDADSLHANDRASYVTAVRLREDESWRRQYGKRLTFNDLNLKDAPIRLRCPEEELCTLDVNPTEKAIQKIAKAIEQANADAVVLPLALGNHIDRLTARYAGLLKPNPAKPHAFYEDLPYALQPGAVETIADIIRTLNLAVQPTFASAPADDVDAAIERKRKHALRYDSQIDDATTRDIAQFSAQYAGRERLWANEAWRASELAAS